MKIQMDNFETYRENFYKTLQHPTAQQIARDGLLGSLIDALLLNSYNNILKIQELENKFDLGFKATLKEEYKEKK